MKAILTICMLAILLSAAPFANARDVDETLKAAAGGTIMIAVPRGRIDVTGWDRDEVHVAGRLDADTKEFVFRNRGSDTVIEVRLEHPNRSWNNDDSDLDIRMPRGSAVQFRGVSLDVAIEDVQGGVKGGTVSGDINVERVTKRADLGTVSGDIFLQSCDGRVHLNSVSGDIDVRECTGEGDYESVSGTIVLRDTKQTEVVCETVSGSIVADLERFQEFRGNSVSGEVELSGSLMDGGRVEVESVSGRVDVALDRNTDARFEVETGSGSISNQLTNDEPRVSEYSRQRELRFKTGEGKGFVSIGTASGRVVLRGN